MMGSGFGGIFGFPWIGVVWVVLLAAGAYVLVRMATGHDHGRRHATGDVRPEDELKRRYARGEISREEYERVLEDLRR